MKSPLYILHLEDDATDAELVQSVLENDGVTAIIARVETRGDFVLALERGGLDLVLSDFDLPTFNGLAAAELVRTRWSTIPLILVSGGLPAPAPHHSAVPACRSRADAADPQSHGRGCRCSPHVVKQGC
jgi:CheY-like chemotaxis protein